MTNLTIHPTDPSVDYSILDGELAKLEIINKNRSNSKSVAIEPESTLVLRKLTVYDKREVGGFYDDVCVQYKMTDADGNKYLYTGSSSKIFEHCEFNLKCRVVKSFESMGIIFNVIKLK